MSYQPGGLQSQDSLQSKLNTLAKMHTKVEELKSQNTNQVPLTTQMTSTSNVADSEYGGLLEAAKGAEMVMCELCYNEERKIDFFAL